MTSQQKQILAVLADGPQSNPGLDDALQKRFNLRYHGYDALHSALKRLERRGLVDRISRPAVWRITESGRQHAA